MKREPGPRMQHRLCEIFHLSIYHTGRTGVSVLPDSTAQRNSYTTIDTRYDRSRWLKNPYSPYFNAVAGEVAVTLAKPQRGMTPLTRATVASHLLLLPWHRHVGKMSQRNASKPSREQGVAHHRSEMRSLKKQEEVCSSTGFCTTGRSASAALQALLPLH